MLEYSSLPNQKTIFCSNTFSIDLEKYGNKILLKLLSYNISRHLVDIFRSHLLLYSFIAPFFQLILHGHGFLHLHYNTRIQNYVHPKSI